MTEEYIYEHSQCHDMFGKPLKAGMLTQREPIVRCRDCEHFLADELGEVCGLFEFEMIDGKMREGFCAWGKRRDGE